MKRVPTILWIALCVAAPSVAQPANATVGELLQALKGPPANEANWIVIPIAGTSFGRDGTIFHTDLVISGSHAFYEGGRMAIAWLPVGRDASGDAVQYMALPGVFDNGSTLYHDGFGHSGFGALVIAMVDSSGALDAQGDISADIRVWSSSSCSGEASLGYHPNRLLGADRGTVIGLTLGDGFRANAGIVNADAVAHTWHVQSVSLDGAVSSDAEVTVPAASSAIVGLNSKVPGPIAVTMEVDAPGVPWTAWGASVDNRSNDGWYSSPAPF